MCDNTYQSEKEKLYICGDFEKVMPEIEKAAKNGNSRDRYLMFLSYKMGAGVSIDNQKAKEWIQDAQKYKDPLLMMEYAYNFCDNDEDEEKIIHPYVNSLKMMADLGDVLAQFEYGAYVYSRKGDVKKGIKYVNDSYDQGFIISGIWLAGLYLNGTDIDKNIDKAFDIYKIGCEKGIPVALNQMAWMMWNEIISKENYNKNYFELWKEAAIKGYDVAEFSTGYLYYNGDGIKQDYYEAVNWFQKASNHDYNMSFYYLGLCYLEGKGVSEKNVDKAIELFEESGKLGYIDAYLKLGDLYFKDINRISDKFDFEKATKWYNIAADMGSVQALTKIGQCYYESGDRQNYKKAFEYFKMAAEKDDADGLYYLWNCYVLGKGISKTDNDMTKQLLEKASEKGNAEAQLLRGQDICFHYKTRQEFDYGLSLLKSAMEQGNKQAKIEFEHYSRYFTN